MDLSTPIPRRRTLRAPIGLAIAALVALVSADGARAVEKRKDPALELLKSLEGDWSGPAVWDQGGRKGSVDFQVRYKTTAGGNTVTEWLFPGTPGEMMSVYYLEGGDVVMTHFCTSANQPRFKLHRSADPNDLDFRCVGGFNMQETDSHMHSARIRVVGPDHIQGAWTSKKGEVLQWEATADLIRRK